MNNDDDVLEPDAKFYTTNIRDCKCIVTSTEFRDIMECTSPNRVDFQKDSYSESTVIEKSL